jgi:hypothetical protein
MFEAHFFHGSAPGGSGIVDQDIDALEMRKGGVDDCLNVGWIFYIACEREGFYAQFLQFSSRLLAALFFAGAEYDVGAHFREAFSHLTAEADGTAGDDGHAAGEIEELSNVHSRRDTFRCVETIGEN